FNSRHIDHLAVVTFVLSVCTHDLASFVRLPTAFDDKLPLGTHCQMLRRVIEHAYYDRRTGFLPIPLEAPCPLRRRAVTTSRHCLRAPSEAPPPALETASIATARLLSS